MAHLFIGHGALAPAGFTYTEGMGIVAVPPGTTLQFYTDAGQAIRFGDITEAFAQLQAPWPALTSENVTYNLCLTPQDDPVADKWVKVTAGSGHELHSPGRDGQPRLIVLCNGTTATCPTDPRQNRAHNCTGLLGRYTGELHWLACTRMMAPEDQAVADVARGDTPPAVFLNNNPDSWAEHTARLVTELKSDLPQWRAEAVGEQGFIDYFNSDELTQEERDHVLAADEEIRKIVTGS